MSTQFTNRQWRLPNNENKDKQSNYSMDFLTTTRIPDITGLGLGTSVDTFSISLWFNKSNMNYGILFSAYSGSGSYFQTGVAIELNTNGTIMFFNGAARTTTSAQYSANTWYNLVVTSDGTTVKMYVNGSQVTLDSTTAQARNFTNVWINSAAYSSNNYGITGKIDGVSIFNYALSSSQVTTLYGSSSTGIGNPMSLSPKPVAYYPLGDQDAFNGASYLTPNASLKDFVFSFSSSQEINCGNDSSVQLGTVFTMSCWINTTSTSRGSIMGTYVSNGYYIDLMASGTVQGGYHSTGSHFLRPSSSTVNDGNWHHVCYVISGTATDGSNLDVYINGQLDNGSFTSSGTPSGAVTTNPFKINLQGYGGRYTGKTSNVQIFNTALSSTDVETLYNNGSPLTSMSGFTSLQGWWKLDASDTYDGTNWTIEDHAGSNDGTSSGMTQANLVQSDLSFTSGYSPYALDFDGTNDYINIASAGGIALMNTGVSSTVSLWVYPTGTGTRVLFEQQSPGRYVIYQSGTSLFFYPNSARASFTNLILNQWYNVITIVDGSNSKFYVNGNEVGTSTSYTPVNTLGVLQFGRYPGGTQYFEGKLSNVSIWNTALTSAQVTEIYSEGVPQNLLNHSAVSSLVSWWQLGSNSSFNTNWTVLDEKGSNNGTSVNMGEDAIVDGVNTYANGLSSGMGGDEVIGDAPYSTANALSVNMDVEDRTDDTPS